MFEINYFYNKYKPNPEVYKFHFAFEYMINGSRRGRHRVLLDLAKLSEGHERCKKNN